MPGSTILLPVAIGVPWLAALVAAIGGRHARVIGVTASLAAALASALLLASARHGDSLGEALMVLFSGLAVGAMLVIPRRDCAARMIAGMLFILGSTLLAYAARNL